MQTAIHVDNVSKKFARSLRHSMWYGLVDVGRTLFVPYRFKSPNYDARMNDAMAKTSPVIAAPADPITHPLNNALPLIPDRDTSGLRTSEFWALRNVSFDIKQGESVGVVGHNGAGKSTLFSILSGIYGPTEGRVAIRGRLQALIALGAGFHPAMTGRENIYINAAILGLKEREIDRLLDQIIDFSGLNEFVDMPVKNYSSGMLVRLGFSVAAHLDPDVLLIDEVLAVGDAAFQQKCQEFSRALASSGKTVVIVTHNTIVIQSICNRCLWFGQGRLIEDGEPQGTVRRYKEHMVEKLKASNKGSMGTGLTVIIRGATPVDATGKELSAIPSGQPISIRVDLHVLQHAKDVKIWVMILDNDYERCLVEASMLEDHRVVSLDPGDHSIIVKWPGLPLNPEARYRISSGIRDWTGQILMAESYSSSGFRVETPISSPAREENGGEWIHTPSMNPIISVPYQWTCRTARIEQQK